jgi:nucleoside-diphosphate-sugar epimerase
MKADNLEAWQGISWFRNMAATLTCQHAACGEDALQGQGIPAWSYTALSYLAKCNVEGREYRVYGYKGKQVRDNIHSEDVPRFILEFWKAPRVAEVYKPGGVREMPAPFWRPLI